MIKIETYQSKEIDVGVLTCIHWKNQRKPGDQAKQAGYLSRFFLGTLGTGTKYQHIRGLKVAAGCEYVSDWCVYPGVLSRVCPNSYPVTAGIENQYPPHDPD